MKLLLFFISIFVLLTTGCNDSKQIPNLSFELEQDEKKIYEQLKDRFDESVLLNVDPISIAKLYIYSNYHNEYDVAYTLYTQREGHVAWSNEDNQMIPERDRGSKEQMIANFRNIENGEFYKQSDHEGYIEYEIETGKKSYFQMIKDENNIWKVSFMPLQ